MANPTQTAKIAAKEDAKTTGPAGLPNTKPAGIKPRLAPEVKAQRQAEMVENHVRLLQDRTQQVCQFLVDQGISSLAGRIASYDDVPQPIVDAVLLEIEARVAKCRAALQARSASAPAVAKVDLRALAAKLQAQRDGTTLPQ